MPLNNHWLFGAGKGDFTVIKILALACLPFALFRLASRLGTSGLRITGVSVWLLVYSSIALASYFLVGEHAWVNLTGNDYLPQTLMLSMLLFFILVVGLIDSMTRLHRVLLTMIGSVGLTSVYVIRDWVFNRIMYADYRPGGVSGDANYFALCASTCLVLGLHLALSGRPRIEKLFLYGCLGVTSIAFLLAASRGGILGLAIGLLYLMARSGRGIRNLAVLGLIIVPLLLVVPNTLVQRFSHPNKGDEEAVDQRKTTWIAGLRMVASHPLVGVGLGNFEFVVVRYEDPTQKPVWHLAHNTYIEVAAELGIPGFLAYLALLISSFRAWGRFTRSKSESQDPLLLDIRVGFQAAFLTAAVCAFFVSAWWYRFFWMVLFLPVCLSAVEQSIAATRALKPQAELAMAGSTR
jgi:O-antigen ligase